MSTVNQYFTMKYFQPEEYHFSHDSVFLARFVFEWLEKNPQAVFFSMADFCSGCGIIGLDLLIHRHQNKFPLPQKVDFIEVQEIYKENFELNRIEFGKNFESEITMTFINLNYSNLINDQSYFRKYDLIVCNPPYFNLGQGKLSPSDFKNRCRFFIDSDLKTLLKSIEFSLTINGVGFLLLRSLKDHKIEYDLNALSEELLLELTVIGDIRGTDVLKIQRVNNCSDM